MIDRITVIGQVEGEKFILIPVSQASKILGYSARHTRRLANEGKLIATKIDRMWFVYPQLIVFCPPTGRPIAS